MGCSGLTPTTCLGWSRHRGGNPVPTSLLGRKRVCCLVVVCFVLLFVCLFVVVCCLFCFLFVFLLFFWWMAVNSVLVPFGTGK